jgi:hypothetical protein
MKNSSFLSLLSFDLHSFDVHVLAFMKVSLPPVAPSLSIPVPVSYSTTHRIYVVQPIPYSMPLMLSLTRPTRRGDPLSRQERTGSMSFGITRTCVME